MRLVQEIHNTIQRSADHDRLRGVLIMRIAEHPARVAVDPAIDGHHDWRTRASTVDAALAPTPAGAATFQFRREKPT